MKKSRAEISKKHYHQHKEKYRQRLRNRYKQERLKYLVKNANFRAKKRGLAGNLRVSDLTIPDKCPILGIPLTEDIDPNRPENVISLHRLDPSLGYTKDNVIIVSWRANRLINDGTLKDFKKIVKFLKTLEKSKTIV